MISSLQLRIFRNQRRFPRNLLLGLAPALLFALLPAEAFAQRSLGRMAPAGATPQASTADGPSRSSAAQYPCMVTPSAIDAGRRAAVRFGAAYPNMNLPANVIFYAVRIQPNGSPQKITALSASQQGTQTVVNGTLQFQEQAGVIHLQVYVAAANATYSSNNTRGNVEVPASQVCSLTVRESSNGQNPSGGPTHEGGGSGGGNGDKASGWGEFAGGLLGGLIKSRHKDNNANDSQPDKVTPPGPQPTPVPMTALSARGLQLKYPQGWNFRSEILDLGGPLNFRNFDRYLRGGVLPAGGAEIDVTTVPFDGQGDLKSMAQKDLGAADASGYRVDDRPALFVSYTDEFAPGFSYENRAVYVAVGNTIYKFFLSYRNGDPGAGNFVRDFQQVLASTHFTRN